MNTTQGPQSQNQYPNGAHFQTAAGPRPAYQYAPPATKQPWWERDGMVAKLFAAAGVFVTLIGVVMLLVIAARAGLLRPEIRVGGGALLSAMLLAASTRLHLRLGGQIGAVALASTGTAGLFLCIVAATNYYEWIPGVAGLVLAAVVAAGAIALAMRWNSQALAVLMTASVAGLAPVLTEGVTVPLIAFLVLLQAAGCIPEFTKSWPAIAAARSLPVAFATTYAIAAERTGTSEQIASYLVATIALTSALAASRSRHEEITAVMYGLASVPMIIAITALTGPVAAVAGAAVAAMTFGSLVLARPVGLATTAAATLVTGAALLAAAMTVTTGDFLSAILLGIGTVLAASVYQVKNHFTAGLALAFIGLGAFDLLTSATLANATDGWTAGHFVGGLLLTANILIALVIGIRRYNADREGVAVFGAMALMVSTAITLLSLSVVALGQNGLDVGHFAVTVCWMLLASALLALSLRGDGKNTGLVVTGLAVAASALAKLFLHDLAALSGIVRAGAFIVVGLLLLSAGTGYAQAFAKRAAARRPVQQSQPAQQQPVQQPQARHYPLPRR